ncbi:RNA-binding protein NOB1 isoform X2 [Choloepus didactylus]|uniref:RNA-binding protein NOB1 isoform X2 n=1 Tax=Choloepus didactylus TaxID=27675 RepID=UPI00189DF402|nr:RNA-binding protein NOB1 isoform X2 [Choloepus didactylus]
MKKYTSFIFRSKADAKEGKLRAISSDISSPLPHFPPGWARCGRRACAQGALTREMRLQPPGEASESLRLFPVPRGLARTQGRTQAPCASALHAHSAKMALVEHVVADAGAFLRDAALQDIGKNIYTIRAVVSEIRDKATRRRLAVLPYELHFKEPFPEYVRLVTEFSKKTGDYPSLSATDIQVLALTYQLEAEFVGVSHLKREPEKFKVSSSVQHPETPLHISGFHLPSKPKASQEKVNHGHPGNELENTEFTSFVFWRNPLPNIDHELQELLIHKDEGISSEEEEDGLADMKEKESDDDEGGWITPSNIKQIQQELEQCDVPTNVRVGCVTTDFAMQYSLPTPKGGKYAINPHLTEDQRFPQLRLSQKARQKTNVFDPDYIAGVSPFAENDICSRSATLQIRDSTLGAGRRRLNPNASRKKFVKKR